ncbi:MAG TPA: hypothetical protein VMF11_10550 [Candidatus Baltobacteraceae bacterium]|nr:hypothetical protein [Candidatus Baltobacteraceae bacterium]
MNMRSIIAGVAIGAVLAFCFPATPVCADGAASTRNLLLLGGAAAATYLIVEHNRKVHQQEAEDAQRQAAAEEQSNDAWSAYHQAEDAYRQEAAANAELEREIAYQHGVVEAQRKELAALDVSTSEAGNGAATVSYGWGTP